MVVSKQATVVIADDHAATRAGVRAALEVDGFTVLGEASNARTAVRFTREYGPDVCLLDIHMPGSGVAAAAEIGTTVPSTAVVMLTYSDADEDLFDALRAGARGYLLKDMDPGRLGAALRGVLCGEAALPRQLAARVLAEFHGGTKRKFFVRGRRPADLTSREWEIMSLLREGLPTEAVAERLFISPTTVRVHISSVLKKLRAADRPTALRMLDEMQ